MIGRTEQLREKFAQPFAASHRGNDVTFLIDENHARDARDAVFASKGQIPAGVRWIVPNDGWKVKAGLPHVLLARAMIFVEAYANDFESLVVIRFVVGQYIWHFHFAWVAEIGE